MSFKPLSKLLKGNLSSGEPLSHYTSFGIGGTAKLLALPADEEDLENLLGFAREEGLRVLVIGAGTNLLVRDGGFPGVVIRLSNRLTGIRPTLEGIEAMAGTEGREVLDYCLAQGLSGMEFAAGIPGSIGGMIKVNAGAFGGETGKIVQKVRGITPEGSWQEWGRDELKFGYRSSHLPAGFLITRAWLKLEWGEREKIKRLISKNLKTKAKTQPLTQRSAGCIFKNPPLAPAGELIEKVGGKGMKVGKAMVSPIHANFIVNLGGATASQVLRLIDQIREKVKRAFGVTLELEVEIVGEEE